MSLHWKTQNPKRMFGQVYKPLALNQLPQRGEPEHRAAFLTLLLLLALPFVQFGTTYWISVQGALFWLLLFFIKKDLPHLQLSLFIGMALLMLSSLVANAYADTLFYAFVRIFRQILALYLIVCAAVNMPWRPRKSFFSIALPLVVVFVSGLIILQYITYEGLGWSHLFIPSNLFIRGYGTIADDTLELASARGFVAEIRPSGTFSEPSYFGFVALSFAYVVFKWVDSARMKAGLLLMLFFALLCSRSASGVVLFCAFIFFAHRRSFSLQHYVMVAGIVVAGFIASGYFLNEGLFDRLLNITDPVKEPSGYVRLVLPLKHIVLVFQEKPFGVLFSELGPLIIHNMEHYTTTIGSGIHLLMGRRVLGTDNGLFNIFITFGIFGFALVIMLPLIIKDSLASVYILFSTQFNGDLLSPDKAVIIAVVLGIHRLKKNAVKSPEASQKETRRAKFLVTQFR